MSRWGKDPSVKGLLGSFGESRGDILIMVGFHLLCSDGTFYVFIGQGISEGINVSKRLCFVYGHRMTRECGSVDKYRVHVLKVESSRY